MFPTHKFYAGQVYLVTHLSILQATFLIKNQATYNQLTRTKANQVSPFPPIHIYTFTPMKFCQGARKQQQLELGKWTKAKSAALDECISVICKKNIFGKKAKNVAKYGGAVSGCICIQLNKT